MQKVQKTPRRRRIYVLTLGLVLVACGAAYVSLEGRPHADMDAFYGWLPPERFDDYRQRAPTEAWAARQLVFFYISHEQTRRGVNNAELLRWATHLGRLGRENDQGLAAVALSNRISCGPGSAAALEELAKWPAPDVREHELDLKRRCAAKGSTASSRQPGAR